MKLERKEWWDLWERFTRESKIEDEWFDKIVQRYGESHRHYHNAEHVAHCLMEFRSAPRWLTENPAEVELALWLHDVIYDPTRADNEEQSAEFARALFREVKADDLLQARVVKLILATKHNAVPANNDERLVVDIDLAILGQDDERFWRYEQEIREEYGFVPEEVFRIKRAEFLEKFLDRKKIYSTDFFTGKYEQRARENLKRSIERLRA